MAASDPSLPEPEQGRETPESIATWLDSELNQFLPGDAEGQFGFGGLLRVLELG